MKKEKEEERIFVVCVNEDQAHTQKSILRSCTKCKKNVWCSPHNAHLDPICITCIKRIKGERTVLIKRKDLMDAYKALNPPMAFEEFEKMCTKMGMRYIESV